MSRKDMARRINEPGKDEKRVIQFDEFRRITSKGQVTIPNLLRKRYNITMDTKLEFIPSSDGILLRPTRDKGGFSELGGTASKRWTVDQMLKRLEQLRMENV